MTTHGTIWIKVSQDGTIEEIAAPKPSGNQLATLQGAVGGYIEFVRMGPNFGAVINEEGRIHGLKPNLRIPGIVGNAVIVKTRGEDFVGFDVIQASLIRTGLESTPLMAEAEAAKHLPGMDVKVFSW